MMSNVEATNVNSSAAAITWTTNGASDIVVRYGTNATNLNLTESNEAMVKNHVMELSGLPPVTTYYYEVQSTDSAENTAIDNNNGAFEKYYSHRIRLSGMAALIYEVVSILFTTSGGTTKLSHEIELFNQRYDTTRSFGRMGERNFFEQHHLYRALHVLQQFWCEQSAKCRGVWDINYKGVQHLQEDPAAVGGQV